MSSRVPPTPITLKVLQVTTASTAARVTIHLVGGTGADTLTGDAGNDTLYGGLGNDGFFGGGGNDTIYGEDGTDTLNGDGGDDLLEGGAGNDTLNGGTGNDQLSGGAGTNIINGGAGTDTVYISLSSSEITSAVLDDFTLWTNVMEDRLASAGGSYAVLATQATTGAVTLSSIGLTLSGVEFLSIRVDGVLTDIEDLYAFGNQAPEAAATAFAATDEDTAVGGSIAALDANERCADVDDHPRSFQRLPRARRPDRRSTHTRQPLISTAPTASKSRSKIHWVQAPFKPFQSA